MDPFIRATVILPFDLVSVIMDIRHPALEVLSKAIEVFRKKKWKRGQFSCFKKKRYRRLDFRESKFSHAH